MTTHITHTLARWVVGKVYTKSDSFAMRTWWNGWGFMTMCSKYKMFYSWNHQFSFENVIFCDAIAMQHYFYEVRRWMRWSTIRFSTDLIRLPLTFYIEIWTKNVINSWIDQKIMNSILFQIDIQWVFVPRTPFPSICHSTRQRPTIRWIQSQF